MLQTAGYLDFYVEKNMTVKKGEKTVKKGEKENEEDVVVLVAVVGVREKKNAVELEVLKK